MQMEIDDQPDLLHLRCKGSFDELSADWLDVMGNRLKSAPVDILMDFSEVTYIDSRAMGALFALNRQVEELGFKIFYCCLSEAVREIFELAGLHQILSLYDTEESALAAAEKERQERQTGRI